MKKLLLPAMLLYGLGAFAQKDNRIVIGRIDTVESHLLNEKRIVYVHVPAGDKAQRFPVLYILDGEQHFLSAVAITEQTRGSIPPMIVVGITNTNRQRDLTPTPVKPDQIVSKQQARQSGGGDIFIGFIEKELIPYIDSHYPTRPYRVFSGHSLGGLEVINALFNHSSLFNGYIAIDPSIWWDGGRWIKKYESQLSHYNLDNKSLFVAIANNIPEGMDTLSVLKDTTATIATVTKALLPFVQSLRQTQTTGLRWSSKFYPKEHHGTVELNAEYDGLLALFDFYPFNYTDVMRNTDLDQAAVIEAHYKRVSDMMGYQVVPLENTVNEMAYSCMAQHRMTIAYKLFSLNTKNYPNSADAFDSLGDYYLEAGDKNNAIMAFTKSLSLHETAETRKKLDGLKQ